MKFKKNIFCIGGGHVGGITMAFIAGKCPQYKVTVYDINKKLIGSWNSDNLPIYEPGLEEIVKSVRNKNLFFTTELAKGIKEAEIIFVCVNTPTKDYGIGAGYAADLYYWEQAARDIMKFSESDKIVVEKSTVPVKTAQAMERILNTSSKKIHFEVISNPEFLAEGTAIKNLEQPDRVLIGYRNTPQGQKARDAIVEIYANWVPKEKIITLDIWSSELSKLASNAFLAQRISSINSISALCEKTECSISEVSLAIGKDKRIGPEFLNASIGFGGSCFKKDILNLVYLCRHHGLHEVANYWEAVIKLNEYQKNRFVEMILNSMFNNLANKKICLFGFAFKANTSDTRETPALTIAIRLLEEKAKLVITDPQALNNAKKDLQKADDTVEYIEDPYKAVKGCDAIAVLTEWEIYKHLDYLKIYKLMRKPAFIFDGRNILDHEKLFALGFNVYPIGKPPMKHF